MNVALNSFLRLAHILRMVGEEEKSGEVRVEQTRVGVGLASIGPVSPECPSISTSSQACEHQVRIGPCDSVVRERRAEGGDWRG